MRTLGLKLGDPRYFIETCMFCKYRVVLEGYKGWKCVVKPAAPKFYPWYGGKVQTCKRWEDKG